MAIGGLLILNLLLLPVAGGFDGNLSWLDLRPWPMWVQVVAWLVLGGSLLIGGSLQGYPYSARCGLATVVLVGGVYGMLDALRWSWYVRAEVIAGDTWMPFSALVAGMFWLIGLSWIMDVGRGTGRHWWVQGLGVLLLVLIFPLLQMRYYGRTDYRRPAQVAVVFGAGAFGDGRCSRALSDRVQTAVDLYHDGMVERLFLSGGPVNQTMTEPEAMRRYAAMQGVPNAAMVLDPAGVNTRATVGNVRHWLNGQSEIQLLAVSHSYHLPRIKMAFEQAGLQVRTVPAKEDRPLRAWPKYVARELVAYWAYYLGLG